MTTYYKVTEKELLALIDVSESASASGHDDEGFARETELAENAIKQILKRAGKKLSVRGKTADCQIPNVQ